MKYEHERGRHGHSRGGRGPGPGNGFGPGFGPGPGPGYGPGPRGRKRRSGRARRGDVRLALLGLLAEEEASGYALMKSVEERSRGVWKTSPGSVYPTLAQLADEELVEPTSQGNGRTEYRLTDAGSAYVAEHAQEIESLWAEVTKEPEGNDALRQSMHRLFETVRSIHEIGSQELAEAAALRTAELDEALQELVATALETRQEAGEQGKQD